MFVIVRDQEEDGPSFYWYGGEAWGFHIGKAAAFETDEYALGTLALIRKATGEAFPAVEVVEIF